MQPSTAGGTAGLALAVLASLSLVGCASTANQEPRTPCDSRPQKTVKLKIKLKDNGAPEKVLKDNGADGNTIKVCPGDYVVWMLKDSDFSLRFKDAGQGKVPFVWAAGQKPGTKVKPREWELIDVVRDDVDRDVDLGYDVITPGGVLDPIIVVEP